MTGKNGLSGNWRLVGTGLAQGLRMNSLLSLVALSLFGFIQSAHALPRCTTENLPRPVSALRACFYLTPVPSRSGTAAAEALAGSNSVEIQFFHATRDNPDEVYFRVLDHNRQCPRERVIAQRRGQAPVCELGTMNLRDFDQNATALLVNHNAWSTALRTGLGNAGVFNWVPSMPALVTSVAASEGSLLILRTILNKRAAAEAAEAGAHAGTRVPSIVTELFGALRSIGSAAWNIVRRPRQFLSVRLGRDARTLELVETTAVRGGGTQGLASLFSNGFILFLEYQIMYRPIYEVTKSLLNEHRYGYADRYANRLSSTLPRLRNCLTSPEDCTNAQRALNEYATAEQIASLMEHSARFLETFQQMNEELAAAMSEHDATADTEAQAEGEQPADTAQPTPEQMRQAAQAAVAAGGPMQMPPMPVLDFDVYRESLKAFFRPACTNPADSSTCGLDLGSTAGFYRPYTEFSLTDRVILH